MSKDKAADIERQTRGQSKNPHWKDERQGHLTASKFGKICQATDGRDLDQMAMGIYDAPALDNIPAIWHGQTYEATALEQFSTKMGKKVKDCGLFVGPDFPFRGAGCAKCGLGLGSGDSGSSRVAKMMEAGWIAG